MAHAPHTLPSRDEIERIVRSVLAQLASGSAVTTRGNVPSAAAKAPSEPQAATVATRELVLTNKVISVAELAGRLTGIARVTVPRGAVFTPAARDELKKYKVAIASAVGPAKSQAARTILLSVVDSTLEPTALAARLEQTGMATERVAQTGWPSAVDALCAGVEKSQRWGLLLCEQEAAAVCLANRVPGIRAALGYSVQAVQAARTALAPNVLVINPRGKSVFELLQLVRAWAGGDQPRVPAALASRLGS